jgi:hypothetical protein
MRPFLRSRIRQDCEESTKIRGRRQQNSFLEQNLDPDRKIQVVSIIGQTNQSGDAHQNERVQMDQENSSNKPIVENNLRTRFRKNLLGGMGTAFLLNSKREDLERAVGLRFLLEQLLPQGKECTMSEKSKPARTRITDLPESVSELSAAELDQVVGGFFPVVRGVGCGCTCVPASCTFCNDTDYVRD